MLLLFFFVGRACYQYDVVFYSSRVMVSYNVCDVCALASRCKAVCPVVFVFLCALRFFFFF